MKIAVLHGAARPQPENPIKKSSVKADGGTQRTQMFFDVRRFFSLFPSASILILCVICVLMDDVHAKAS